MASEYIELIRSIKPKKRLGQNFLVNVDIARKEASYGAGKTVLELGAGLGILTKELCTVARRVIAVEKDQMLFSLLEAGLSCKNAVLLNADFFELDSKSIDGAEILIANLPYNLSSKIISWLSQHKMPALLCLQKEFVEHLLAAQDTSKYSKLSVMAGLELSVYKVMNVKAGNFYPRPNVDSAIVFIKPKEHIDGKTAHIIATLMIHKKKKLRNAIIDSNRALGISASKAFEIAESMDNANERVFKMSPVKLKSTAEMLAKKINEAQKE